MLSSDSQLVRNRKHLLPEETESWNSAEWQNTIGDYLANMFERKYSVYNRNALHFFAAIPSFRGSGCFTSTS